ncbi:MAG: hypothetical protein ACK53L_06355, partial [Pirellulaceae bacterium]
GDSVNEMQGGWETNDTACSLAVSRIPWTRRRESRLGRLAGGAVSKRTGSYRHGFMAIVVLLRNAL